MTVRLNRGLIRLALGCIQPVSAEQLAAFIGSSLPKDSQAPEAAGIRLVLDDWAAIGDVLCVHKRHALYSLTAQGSNKLSPAERKVRDRTRMFLLKGLRSATLHSPERRGTEQADDSSAVSHDATQHEDERPIGAADSPRPARSAVRAYWPLLSKQLFVGSSSPSSGTFFRFLSFPSMRACAVAAGLDGVPDQGLGAAQIALALGVSTQAIGGLVHRPEFHYRVFDIPKSTGGTRRIHSPRTFMKVTQYFILDYLLGRLKAHPAATAYSAGCSVKDNAQRHVGKRFVANIDVSDFFGSLSTRVVAQRLIESGIPQNTAAFIARISSYEGGLPQGAPTSAALSNICLHAVDNALQQESIGREVTYSRYADDITFSGNDLAQVTACIGAARRELANLGLALNDSKTRIFGPSSRQVVTGVVVNEFAQPQRTKRRQLRAMLHRALQEPERFASSLDVLQGKASYMLSYSSPERGVGALPTEYVMNALGAVQAARKKSPVAS